MRIDETSMARLMAMAQDGDRAAYASLLEGCQHWLRRYLARRVPPHQLDDVVQETLMSVHRKRASYDPQRPFLPWLAAISRYRWVDHLRRIYRNNETELDDNVAADSGEGEMIARISLERLFAHLPPAQIEAIKLVRIEGLSISEASQATGQSESLVKVNIHRGIKRLAALIEKA